MGKLHWKVIWENFQAEILAIDKNEYRSSVFLAKCIDFIKILSEYINKAKNKEVLIKEFRKYDFDFFLTVNSSDFEFEFNPNNIQAEISAFFSREPDNGKIFIQRLFYFIEYFIFYNTEIECEVCISGELHTLRYEEDIFFECPNCTSVFDKNLIKVKPSKQLYYCDKSFLIKKNIL